MTWTWLSSLCARAVRAQTARALQSRKDAPPSWLEGFSLLGLGFFMFILGSQLLGNARLWMTAERVFGEVVDQGKKNRGGFRPVVRATVGEHTFNLPFGLPATTEPPPVGSTVTVLVPASGVEDARVFRARELFIMPGIALLLTTLVFVMLARSMHRRSDS